MKINYNLLKIGTTLLLLMLPIILLASGTESNDASTLSFFKGNGALETWFLEAFKDTELKIGDKARDAAILGRAIGAIGALMYLGWLGWQMQEGARPWEVTPMIKPIIVGLILSNWVGFTNLIKTPLEQLSKPNIAMFNEIEKEADALRVKRFSLQLKVIDKSIEIEVENKFKQEELKDNKEGVSKMIDELGSSVKNAFNSLAIEVYKYTAKINMGMQWALAELVEFIALVILRVCVYGIFAYQKVWSFVLIIIGPIAVGISLIPGFESSMQNWIAKFININLFGFVAHIGMSIGYVLIISAYTIEVSRYEELLKGADEIVTAKVALSMTALGSLNLALTSVVAYIITGFLTLMTPSIADTIVSAGGAGLASKAKANAQKTKKEMEKIGKAGKAIATKGASLAQDAGKKFMDLLGKK